MRTSNMKLEALEVFTVRFAWGFAATVLLMLLLLALLLVAGGLTNSSFAQDAQARTFASAGEAVNALFEAAEKEDEKALEAILGAGKDVTSSSDEVEDKLEREQFSQKYQEMHRLVREPDGSTVLYIGAENWPFPVPLAFKNGAWYFDSARGKQEVLFRRIGENESTAIDVCEEFAMAKKGGDDASLADQDPILHFVERMVSAGTATPSNKEFDLFHGYYFRIVPENSAAQPSDGTRTRGLTLIAYPAEYRSSGIMTFVVTRSGIVYEKDLGSGTTTAVPQLKPPLGPSWHPAM